MLSDQNSMVATWIRPMTHIPNRTPPSQTNKLAATRARASLIQISTTRPRPTNTIVAPARC